MKRVVVALVLVLVGVGVGVAGCSSGSPSEGGPSTEGPGGKPGVWTEPALVHDLPGTSTNATVLADGTGKALAVWEFRPDGAGSDVGVWASRFDGTWAVPESIADGFSWIYYLQVAGNASGEAIAAWGGYDGRTYRLLVSRSEPDGSWSAPETLAIDEGDWPRVAIDDAGHALVVWRTGTAMDETLRGRLYDPETGWQTATVLAEGIDLAESYWGSGGGVFDIALDPSRGALLVWAESGASGEIRARRAEAAPGSTGPFAWQPVEPLATLGTADAVQRLFAGLDDNGPAAIWAHHVDEERVTYAISTSRRSPSGWESATSLAEAVPSTFGFFTNEARAVLSRGAAAVLWREVADERGRIFARRFSSASGWAASELLASDLAPPIGCTTEGMAEAMDLAIDASGRTVATWEVGTAETFGVDVAAREYVPGTGWSDVMPLPGNVASGSSQAPRAAVSAKAGFVAWTRQEQVDAEWSQGLWFSHVLAGEGLRTAAP